MNQNHDYYMDLALQRAREAVAKGGRPTYVVIVKDGRIIGQGRNTVDADNDPSAHAEVNAIRDACSKPMNSGPS